MIHTSVIQGANFSPPLQAAKTNTSAVDISKQFGDYLQEALNGVQSQQNQVTQLQDAFIRGEMTDVHNLMISAEKATLALELTVQVRNKVVEAYQEIMRIQI